MSEPLETTAPPLGDDPALLALISMEMDLDRQRGQRADVEEYCRRFPHLAAAIRQRWGLTSSASEDVGLPTAASALPSAEALLAAAARAGLVEPQRLQQLREELAAQPHDALQLGRELLQRGWLTAYQVNHLLQGKEADLHVGPYQLLQRLGKGGMGQVFQARHSRLGRVVALKLISPQHLGDPAARRRFLREMRSLSRLDHPNIVRALDAGEEEGGRLYLVMDFVEGADLAHLVKEQGGLPIGQACDCARQAALALQHAHDKGLVHRDVKPSNLLRTPDGTVKLLDVGLARLRAPEEAEGSTTLTDTGMAMGTPDYVAPEQITDSKRVDIRADLYSLGCTLYHLLSGRPPFAGGMVAHKLLRHQTEEPEALAALRPEVPAALAAVVQKLMAKKPEERYQSPAEVAAALGHLLRTGKWAAGPFAGVAGWGAMPASLLRRARPTWQGRRLLAALAIVGLLFASVGLAVWFWPQPRPAPPEPEGAKQAGSCLDQLAFAKIRKAERLGTLLRPETVQVLGSHQGQHGSPLRCLALHPDGKRAFSGGVDGVVRVWSTATLRQEAALTVGRDVDGLSVVGEPGGELTLCAVTPTGELLRWSADDLRPLGRSALPGPVKCFSPDGCYGLYALGGNASLVDIPTGQELKRFRESVPGVGLHGGSAFTADGKRAVVAVRKGQFALLETATGKELWRFHGAPDFITHLVMTPDGKHVLSGDVAGRVWLWEVATNRVVRRFFLGQPVRGLTLSADGRRALFLYGQGLMQLWDLEGDRKLRDLGSDQDNSGLLVMTADGDRAVTGDVYGRVRLWDLKRGEALCPRPDNGGEALCVALSPDGRLALAGYLGLAVLYDVHSGQVARRVPGKGGRILSAAFSPDSSRFAYGDEQGKLHLCRTRTAEELWGTLAHPGFVRALVFSPDGKRLYSGGGPGWPSPQHREEGAIRAWSTATGQAVGILPGHLPPVRSLALSPDGTRLLSGGGTVNHRDCTVRLWDMASRRQLERFDDHKTPVTSLAFAPDGKWFVSASHLQTILWDLEATPTPARRALTVQGSRALTFVAGRQVVTAENDRQLVVCAADGAVVSARLLPHLVNALALSHDGKHLVTANSNGTVYILRLPLRRR
jgi:WD40 repeat protein